MPISERWKLGEQRELDFATQYKKRTGLGLLHHPAHFRLTDSSGNRRGSYAPDFYCKQTDRYFEVLGTTACYYKHKPQFAMLSECFPHLVLELVNPDGTTFVVPASNHNISKLKSSDDRFAVARKSMGITQAEFAKQIGTHPCIISKLERSNLVSAQVFHSAAKALGISAA